MTKIKTAICMVLLLLIGGVMGASAQITWGTPQTMLGDSDVSATGSAFDAATFHSSNVTVNGVTFNTLGSSNSDGKISVYVPNGVGAYSSPFTTSSPSSTAYSQLTDTLGFGYYVNGTVTISGLTVGHTYQVQAWSYWTGAGSGESTTFSSTNTVTLNTALGQYATGTFTATTAAVSFTYGAAGHCILSAVSVRDTASGGSGGSAPAAPTALTATASSALVNLSWTGNAQATSYNVYRGTSTASLALLSQGLSATSYADSSVTNNTTYYYAAVAVNTSGSSTYSNIVSATPASSGGGGTYSAQITWSTTQSMVGNTDVSTSGSAFDAVTFHASSVTVNGVTFNTLGSSNSDGMISVTAPNGVGQYTTAFTTSSPSSAAYSQLTDTLGFGYYVNGTVTISGLTIGHSYQVQAWSYWNGAGTGESTSFTAGNTITLNTALGQYALGAFTAASTTASFTYNATGHCIINAVSVRDITSGGGSGSAPTAPTGLTATASSAQVNLNWAASSGATSYSVYRGTSTGSETVLQTGLTSTSFTNTGLTNGTTYYYKVTASNSYGSSTYSSEVSATPSAGTVPAAPTGLAATAGNALVSLNWTGSSGATSYNVYRSTSTGSETVLQTGIGSTSYADTSVTNSTTYYYKVAAVNSVGTSTYSNEVSATPIAGTANLVLAVGLERIVSGYNGPAIRIQRATDNAQQDIGFASGSNLLNTASVSAFLGSQGQGWVVTLYSQDGSGHNLTTPSGTDNMPMISMTAPTTMTINGTTVLTARCDTNMRYFILPSSVSVNKAQMSAFLAFRPDFSGGQGEPVFEIGSYSTDAVDLQITGNGLEGLSHNSVPQLVGGFSGTPGIWYPGVYPRTQATVVGLVTSPSSLATVYLDGIARSTGGTISGSVTCSGGTLMAGTSTYGLAPCSANFLAFELYSGTVNASTAVSITNTMLPRTVPTINIAGDGDSITQGTGDTYGYNALRYAETQFTKPVDLTNIAIYGTRTYDTLSKVSNLTIPTSPIGLIYNSSYTKNIYYLAIGTNDIHGGSTGADTWSRAQQCLQNAKSLGYKTAVATVLHEFTETAAQGTEVDNFNALARAAVGQSYLDAIIDYAADSRIGVASNFYPAYTADGTHPNDAGYQIMGTIAAPVLNTLIGP